MHWIDSYHSTVGSLQNTSLRQNDNATNHQSGTAFADILATRINEESRAIDNTDVLSPEIVRLLSIILTRYLHGGITTTNTWLDNYRASFPTPLTPPPPSNPNVSTQAVPQTAPPPSHTDFSSLINKAASRYQLDPSLITSVIKTESDFNPRAVSHAGAQGLMQLMPETADELEVTDPLDPAQNIDGGSRYLANLIKRYHGDTKLALAAYNWGMGNLERQPENMPEETKNYVTKIMHLWDQKRTELV